MSCLKVTNDNKNKNKTIFQVDTACSQVSTGIFNVSTGIYNFSTDLGLIFFKFL